jgi:hypothetical protein
MKRFICYYFLILFPIFFMLWIMFYINNSFIFVISLLIYTLIYRFVVDANRMIYKGILQRKNWWKIYIPGYHLKWFSELYLKY